MRYLLTVALLLSAAPVAAQDLKLPTIAFAAGASADWVATHRNMDVWHEQNPLLNWLDDKPTAMVAFGAALDTAGYVGWIKLTKNHTKLRAIGLYSAAAFRVYLAARHIRHRQKHLPR